MTNEEADNAQEWAGMDAATAWLLIYRHADGWHEIGGMVEAWMRANSTAWHDAPTCAGLWICDEASDLKYEWRVQRVTLPLNSMLLGEGERWYGPIPDDTGVGT